jgi:hypothetical protein
MFGRAVIRQMLEHLGAILGGMAARAGWQLLDLPLPGGEANEFISKQELTPRLEDEFLFH